jgi:hypothetical protein
MVAFTETEAGRFFRFFSLPLVAIHGLDLTSSASRMMRAMRTGSPAAR